VTWLTQWLKNSLQEVQEYFVLLGKVARGLVTRPFYMRDVIEQFDSIGAGSLTVVLLTGTFTGMVLALQSGITLDKFGARSMVGQLVSASMIKELGPVLTALMVCGRVGSGIAAELGSMMVTDQIAALRALGTDPVRKLVIPRVIAGTLMVPLLTVVADGVGLVGAWLIALTQLKVASAPFWNSVVAGLYIEDVWMGLIKPFFLGFVLVSIGCHVGLRTTGGTQGVGRSTTQAEVAGSVAVLIVAFLLSVGFVVANGGLTLTAAVTAPSVSPSGNVLAEAETAAPSDTPIATAAPTPSVTPAPTATPIPTRGSAH